MTIQSITKSGFVVGEWPYPLPTGLDLYLVRRALGLSQRSMAFELQINRDRIIEWERAGATMTIPARNVAWRVSMLWFYCMQKGLLPKLPVSERPASQITSAYIKVHGNGDQDWA